MHNNPSYQASHIASLYQEIQSKISQTNQTTQQYLPTDIGSFTDILKESILSVITSETSKLISKYENIIKSLEQQIRKLYKTIMYQNLQIDSMENQIISYIEMEEEFEELKTKVKYDEGEFLMNERKDNEILIIRAENSNLKNIIKSLENDALLKNERILRLTKKLKNYESGVLSNKESSTSTNTTQNTKRSVIHINHCSEAKAQKQKSKKNVIRKISNRPVYRMESSFNDGPKSARVFSKSSLEKRKKYSKSPSDKSLNNTIKSIMNSLPSKKNKEYKVLSKMYLKKNESKKHINRSSFNFRPIG